MPHTPWALAGVLIQIVGCFWALWRGETASRLAAAVLLAANLVVGVVQDRISWVDPQHRLMALDLFQFFAFGWLLARYRRRWLFAATIFQQLAAGADLVILIDPLAAVRAWLSVTMACGWAVFICVLAGGLHGASRQPSGRLVSGH